MTTGTAKLYDRLDATERTSALLAAMVRGDDVEQHRLNVTAPQRIDRRFHHCDRVQAVWDVAATARIEQLTTLANLWHAQARLAWAVDNAEADGEAGEDINRDARLWRAFADVAAWKLVQQRAAWLIVADKLGIAAEFLDQFGDCIALRLAEDRLAEHTPTAEVVRERLAEFGDVAGELATADSIAAGWLDLFAKLER